MKYGFSSIISQFLTYMNQFDAELIQFQWNTPKLWMQFSIEMMLVLVLGLAEAKPDKDGSINS